MLPKKINHLVGRKRVVKIKVWTGKGVEQIPKMWKH
jgi:hypothetical protein